jgi:hypothetical protein
VLVDRWCFRGEEQPDQAAVGAGDYDAGQVSVPQAVHEIGDLLSAAR